MHKAGATRPCLWLIRAFLGHALTRPAGILGYIRLLSFLLNPHWIFQGACAVSGWEQVLEEVKRTLFAGKAVHMLREVAGGEWGNEAVLCGNAEA